MDSQDVPGSPEWRPASSLSNAAPSTVTSSVHYYPPSFRPTTGNATSSASSAFASMAVHGVSENDISARELGPNDTTACERLTDEIRCYLRGRDDDQQVPTSPSTSTTRVTSLESTIRHAASTIRYNAKWFEPTALATLILVTLQAVILSSSSADLYAALSLVDTIGTFSILPPSVLLPVSRYIAYAYFRGTDQNRLKKLTKYSWEVALHMLQSHLGEQFVGALLDIIRDDDDVFDDRRRFAQVTGALKMVSEHLIDRQDELPSVQLATLLLTLRDAAIGHDGLIRDHILDILGKVLQDDEKLRDLDDSAVSDALLDITESCVNSTSTQPTLQPVLRLLEERMDRMEPRHLQRLAWLFIKAGRALPPEIQYEAVIAWQNSLVGPVWTESHNQVLVTLSDSILYLEELSRMMNRTCEIFLHCDDSEAMQAMLKGVDGVLNDPSIVMPACDVIGKELVLAFERCMQGTFQAWKQVMFFQVLCDISDRSPDAAKMLFRLRADVRGTIYFDPDNTSTHGTSSTMVSHEANDAWHLPVSQWHDTIFIIIKGGAKTWPAYDCALNHLPAMLSNHKMFDHSPALIKVLLHAVCSHLDDSTYQIPPASTGLTRYYVVTHLIRILTIMTSYHRYLDKQEIRRTIAHFHDSAGAGDHVVSKTCIHALTVCCAELPDAMSSCMREIIDKMSKMVTQRFLAIHVLQFLAGLSRLPELHRNFTQLDYKKVFGVCFSYLRTTRGAKIIAERKLTPTSESSSTTPVEEALPEYVYALAHHLITFWYLSLQPHDREGLKPYITSALSYKDADGNDALEDQGLVTVDMMDRVDAEGEQGDWTLEGHENPVQSNPQDGLFAAIDGRLVSSRRLFGTLLITTITSLRTGRSLVTVRRPSGTTHRMVAGKERANITNEGDGESYIPVVPCDEEGKTYGSITLPKQTSALATSPVIPLNATDVTNRAIQMFDRTPALDSHKIGVVYIGERQTNDEKRILHNVSGSPDYRELLADLGSLERLQGAKFNTQGLDRADDIDGTHTYVWHNKVMELVYHVTTLMPNSEDPQEEMARKKRHIGNDHVNIIFNNSGIPLDFGALYNIFPGQFTHVYIVITPVARTSFVEARTENIAAEKRDRFYGVQVVARPGYPNVSPAAEEKVVSGICLGGFVRNLALNECIISLMWTSRNESSEYPSSWRSRLHQLRRLAERNG